MRKFLPILSVMATVPGAALAHGEHWGGYGAGSFAAGAAHPLSGADHVLAMVAVGLWAAQAGGRARWALPAGFVAAMVLGGAMGAAGLPFAAVEPMILASIIVLGALVALAARLPLVAALPLIALFGAAHGWAHGAEGPTSGMASYALGFALVTAALHGLGLALGAGFGALGAGLGARALRVFGGAAAVAGLALTIAG